MDATQAETMLRRLGCSKIKVRGFKWVVSSCPLASYDHSYGRDEKPSFAVSIEPGGSSWCRCLACGFSGSPQTLLWRLRFRHGRSDVEDLMMFVSRTNQPSVSDLKDRLERASNYDGPRQPLPSVVAAHEALAAIGKARPDAQLELPVMDDALLERFESVPEEVQTYLTDARKLTPRTIVEWEVGWQPYARRVVIPIRDGQGRLVGISGRAFDPDQEPKYLHSTGFKRDFYLYGEHKLVPGKVGYLTEGFFDVMRLWQTGYDNAIAMMGSYLSRWQIEKIVGTFSSLVVFLDGDKAGQEASNRVEEALSMRMHVRVARPPAGKDPGDLHPEELKELLGPPGAC